MKNSTKESTKGKIIASLVLIGFLALSLGTAALISHITGLEWWKILLIKKIFS